MIEGQDPVAILKDGLAVAKEINDVTLVRTKFALLVDSAHGPEVTQAVLIKSAMGLPQEQLAVMYTELAWRLIDKPS